MRSFFLQAFSRLFETSPALLYAIPLLLGTLFALETLWPLFLFLFFLCTLEPKRIPCMTLIFLAPLTWIHIPEESVEGEGTFFVETITYSRSHFGSGWCMKGRWSFDDKTKGRRLPCQLFPKEKMEGTAFSGYGHIEKVGSFYRLKCENLTSVKHFSLAPYRHVAKQRVRAYIKRHVPQHEAADFLNGIFTGEIENKLLLSNFSKLGLSHLLAISGLHFALLALFLRRLLFFLPRKAATCSLLILLTLYFLFVGNTPSVQRAWIFTLLIYVAELLEKRSYALNTLGVALLIATVVSPFALKTLSFQLTFLATAGILLYYPHLRREHNGVVLSWIRNAFVLTIAVHILILPLLLLRFHYFHPHTLFYNLFFPSAASLSLILFLIALFIPPLHTVNALYTTALLKIVENPPLLLPGIYFESVPLLLISITLVAIFVLGVLLRFRRDLSSL